jgi:hypothetical protein
MPKQKVPDIDFKPFVIAELPELFRANKIKINLEYQRGDIWKKRQQIELITSINKRYSIGVLVLFINDSGQYEILDGNNDFSQFINILTINLIFLEQKLTFTLNLIHRKKLYLMHIAFTI